jgi:hypothetical protein
VVFVMNDIERWRGAAALLRDAVEHGSRAVQRVQLETARRPFAIIASIPVVAGPARVVHAAHDASVTAVHETIRLVNGAVGGAVDFALRLAEKRQE